MESRRGVFGVTARNTRSHQRTNRHWTSAEESAACRLQAETLKSD